jgi:hypothetical protein
MTKLCYAILLTSAATMSGCETDFPYLDSHLGKSAEKMVQAQTLNPSVAASPALLAPEGADGQRIKNAVDNYYKDVPREGQTVSRPVAFEAGK